MEQVEQIARLLAMYVGMAAVLVPPVLALTALVNKIANPPTRWKPGITTAVGITLGILLALRLELLWYDGSAVGLVAALIAGGFWQEGKRQEGTIDGQVETMTTTTWTAPPVQPEPPKVAPNG